MRKLLVMRSIILAPSMAQAVSCTVSAVTMAFGSYNGAANSGYGPTPITVNCTAGAAYNVGVNTGLHGSGASYNWNLVNSGSATIGYQLYCDSARSMLLGGTAGLDTISGTGTGSNQTVYIYPATLATTAVVPGSYSDTVTVTVTSGGPTVTTSMSVSATVFKSCTVSAAPLAFGIYTGVTIDLVGTISVTCTNTTTYYVNLNSGLHVNAFNHPQMQGASGEYIAYDPFRDSARSQYFGNTNGSDGVAGTGSGQSQPVYVYSRCYSGYYVTPGNYADTVTVTIHY